MKQTTLALFGFSLLVLCGCVAPKSEFAPPSGIFCNYKAPLMLNYDKSSVSSTGGAASAEYFHDILLTGLDFGWGDCSALEATRNGRINRIGTADYEFLNILGIYAKTTVHVYQAQPDK